MIKTLTDDNVDSVLKDDKTFLVLFKHDDSPNTTNVLAVFAEYDQKFDGKIDVYVCDYLKETKKITKYFQMRVLPSVVMMKRNKPYVNIVGPVSVGQYHNAITKGIADIMNEDEDYKSLPDNEYTL